MRTTAASRRLSRRPFARPLAASAVLAVTLIGLPSVAHAADPVVVGGDTRELAVPIDFLGPLGGQFTASNVGKISAADPAPYVDNAWYSYTPAHSGQLTVFADARPAEYDVTLQVRNAAGGLLAMNDAAPLIGIDAAQVTVLVTGGSTYYIGMGRYDGAPNWPANGTAAMTLTLVPPPIAPLNVTAVEGDASAVVSWDVPPETYAPLSGYTVWCTPAGGVEVACGSTSSVDGAAPATTATVTGLSNGTAYSVRVTATNAVGTSPFSEPASVTPRAVSSIVLAVEPAVPVSGQPYHVIVDVYSHGVRVDGGTLTAVTPSWTFVGISTTSSVWVHQNSPVGDHAFSFSYSGTTSIAPSSASLTVSVVKAPQTVEIVTLLGDRPYSPDPITLAATATSGLTVTFAASGVCTVSGDELSLTGIGECTVTASQAGTDQIEAATDSVTFAVAKRTQGMFLNIVIDGPLVFGRPPVTVVGGSDVGLPVTFTGAGSCTMVDDVMHATGVGPCTITVSQAGDAVTEPAELVSEPLEIAKRPQALSITGLPVLVTGNGQFSVSGVSDVGLPVTLAASGACTISGGVVTVVDVGTCTVTASQAGDEHTLPATATATATVVGTPASASLRIGFAVGDAAQGTPVTVTGAGLRPGTALTLTVYSTPTQVGTAAASVLGSAVTVGELPALEAGEHRVVARGTALDGERVTTLVRFAVDENGVVTRIGAPADLATSGTTTDAGLLALLWFVAGAGLIVIRRNLGRRTATA